MKRDTARLAERPFDVLVVGAGIYGACIARDAAQRGLRTALIERDDFGALTSHNSFKLVHGGLRYLQQLDLSRLRQSAREQRIWLHIAPHLVEPLAFVMPTFGHGSRGPLALRLALLAYEWLSRGGAPVMPRVPPGRIVGKDEARRLLPGLNRPQMNGAAIWHDVQMLNADRLLLECVIDAADEGAVVANHVAAEGWLGDRDRITGVMARDRLGDHCFEIRAGLTINAAGPFAGNLVELLPGGPREAFGGLSPGLNLVVRKPLTQGHAIAVSSRRRSDSLVPRADGRLFFIQPWQGLSLIGTSHLPHQGDAAHFAFDEAWLADFVAEVNDAYPAAALTRDDIIYAYAGLTPAAKEPRGSEVQRSRRGVVLDHGETQGLDGLISLQGVKYTTARLVAESVVDLALAKLGRPRVACRSWQTRLPGARGLDPEAAGQAARKAAAPEASDAADALVAEMGSLWSAVLDSALEKPASSDQIFVARVRHAVRSEMACSLEDVLLRRLDRVARGRLDGAEVRLAADVLATERGWSDATRTAALASFADEIARHRPEGAALETTTSPPPAAKETADHAE